MPIKHPSLQQALTQENPLQIAGTINAYAAVLAKHAGFKAIYLSGAGVANAAFAIPDLGMTTMTNVIDEAKKITDACDLPLLVDIDTGFGNALNIERTIKGLIKANAKGVHIEDQIQSKRCGHRPRKELVSTEEMCDRIKACLDARTEKDFTIMARTDALDIEGLDKAKDRIHRYIETGADMIFFEGVKKLEQYTAITKACKVPVLANITEFGQTPLFTKDELRDAGIQLILYPLSAFRAMSAAALNVYTTLRQQGTQASLINKMQTREELYELLNYHQYEKQLDDIIAKGK